MSSNSPPPDKIRYSSADLLRIRQLLRRREGEGQAKEILQAASPLVPRRAPKDSDISPLPQRPGANPDDQRAVTPTRRHDGDVHGGGPTPISLRQLNFLKGSEPPKGPGTPTHRRALSVPSDLGAVEGLPMSENRWVPRRGQVTEDDRLFKLIKGILNKLTPEKFDTLIGQLMAVEVDTVGRLKGITDIVFDKGVTEPSFSTMYSDLCVRLSGHLPEFPDGEDASRPPNTFKRFLLSRCQEEFEKEPRFEEYEGLPTEERLEKEGKLKRRITGNVRFIGELFKKKMLGSWVIHECIARRLHLRIEGGGKAGEGPPPGSGPVRLEPDGTWPAEHELEALSALLGTVGKLLDAGGPPHRVRLDAYFGRIRSIAADAAAPYAPRIRFMLQALVELRRSGWVPRRAEAVAKKIDQIRADLEQEQAQRGMGPRRHSGHARTGSGDWRALAEASGRPHWTPAAPGGDRRSPLAAPQPAAAAAAAPGRTATPVASAPPAAPPAAVMPVPSSTPPVPILAPAPAPAPPSEDDAGPSARPGHRRAISMSSSPFSLSAVAAAAANTNATEVRSKGGCTLGTVAESPEKRGLSTPAEGTPPRVSQARFEQLGNSLLEEFWAANNVEEATAAARELPDMRHYGPWLVSAAVTQALDRREKERLAVVPLLLALHRAALLPPPLLERGLDELYEIAGELEVDFPRASLFMAALLAKLLAAGAVTPPYLCRALTLAAPSKKAPRMFALCAKLLAKEMGGKEAARDLFGRSGLALATLFEPDERTPALIQAFLDDENLGYLR